MSEHTQREAPAKKKPTTFSELYPGRFLHADHLKGKQVTLKIADVDIEKLHGEKGEELKAVLAFERTPLLLVLAKLNGQCLKAMFGANVQKWIGKRVTFWPTDEFMPLKRGEACVRVWGSPDIDREINLEIPMPRRKAVKMTMHVVQEKNGQAKAQPAPTPAPPPPSELPVSGGDDEDGDQAGDLP